MEENLKINESTIAQDKARQELEEAKSVSYIVGLCMYMLCKVLFGKRSE